MWPVVLSLALCDAQNLVKELSSTKRRKVPAALVAHA